ncbi:MAG: hypothetical protein ACPLPR_01945 [Bacillota bacterium]
MDLESRVKQLREAIESSRRLRIRAEERLKSLEERKEKVLKRVAELGVDPQRLDEEIRHLQAQIDRLTAEAEKLIPWDLLKRGS